MKSIARAALIAAAAVGVALALSACTGSNDSGSTKAGAQRTPSGASAKGDASTSASPGGVEGVTGTATATCKITSASAVAQAFGGKVSSESPGTSGTGIPICHFTLSKTNLGTPGSVSLTSNPNVTPASFTQLEKSTPGTTPVTGVGDRAFYISATSTLQLMKHKTVIVIQASVHVPGAPQQQPDRLRANLITLGKSAEATI